MNDGLKSVRNRHDDAVSRLDGEQVRALLAEYYRQQGYRVGSFDVAATVDSGAAAAAGPELGLRLHREDSHLLVRCLHWNDKQVPHQRMRAWQDVLEAEPADGSIFVTSGEFTPSAIRTASLSKTLRLVDGIELRKMLMPLLNEGEHQAEGDAPFVDVSAFAEDIAASPSFRSPVAADVEAEAAVSPPGFEAPANLAQALESHADDTIESQGKAQVEPGSKTKTSKTIAAPRSGESLQERLKRMMWERGSRPASNMSIAVAIVLLSLTVLTIVFRDRLDPYLGDSKPPAAATPRNESPLAGTDYKSDVFDPAIRAQDEPVVQAPKPRRPINGQSQSSQPSPDEAIKVIERNTPEMWNEQQRRRAAAEEQRRKAASKE
jgi:Restriction endonuclease